MSGGTGDPRHRVAFVCVQNAGRSQMARAFAERELDRRSLHDRIEVLTGGTKPADRVHEGVVAAMREVGIDLTDRTPREITAEELESADVVVTMGCEATDVCPAPRIGDARDWNLDDPHRRDLERVREIRDEIERRVVSLLDTLEGRVDA